MKNQLFLIVLLMFSFLVHGQKSENSNNANEKEIKVSGKRINGDHRIGKWKLRRILKGKTAEFFKASGYTGDAIHDEHDKSNLIPFVADKNINITDLIIRNYYANNKYVRIYLKNNKAGTDSVVVTINIAKLKMRGVKKGCAEKSTLCCDSCMEVNSQTFLMDMCNREYCMNVKRPMLISSGQCIRNNELKIGCNQLLSFVITNINPLKYELEVNHQEVAFNTDHTSFDAAMSRLSGTTTSAAETNSLVPKKEPAVTPTELLGNFKMDLDSLDLLLKQVQAYIELKTGENCINESELKRDALGFMKRYQAVFDNTEPEKKFEEYETKLKTSTLTPTLTAEETKKFDDLKKRAAQSTAKVKELKELLGKLLSASTTFAMLPIQVNEDDADVIEISVRRKNISTKVSDQYKYSFRVRGGVKIDFSAGPFLSFLKDEKFTTQDRKDTLAGSGGKDSIVARRIIKRQHGDDFSYMFGSLMHVYFRSGGYLNGSLHLGAAISTQQRAVLMTGVSLIIGRQQRFCINGGIAFSTVKRLAAPYSIGDVYEASGDVPLVDRYLAGACFGFTYNLSKPKVVAQTGN
jgi:hypothetical protein